MEKVAMLGLNPMTFTIAENLAYKGYKVVAMDDQEININKAKALDFENLYVGGHQMAKLEKATTEDYDLWILSMPNKMDLVLAALVLLKKKEKIKAIILIEDGNQEKIVKLMDKDNSWKVIRLDRLVGEEIMKVVQNP